MSIRGKLRLSIALIVVLALSLSCGVFIYSTVTRLSADMVHKNEILASIVGENSTAALSFMDADTARGVLSALDANPRVVAACIYDADGTPFAQYRRNEDAEFDPPEVAEASAEFTEAGLELYRPIMLDEEQIGTVYLNSDLQERHDAISRLLATTVVIMVVCLVIALALAALLERSIVKPMRQIIQRFEEIAEGDGDLTQRVDETRRDEIGELGKRFNRFVARIHDIVAAVKQTTQELAQRATDISGSSDDLARNMNEQTRQVDQVAAAIEEMAASVKEVAAKAADAATNAGRAGDAANQGGEVVRETIEGMHSINEAVNSSAASVQELGKRGEQIGQIIEVINDIADQTNLLALNAAIEAARAGEHGRGFAVVADEVRKLAERTTKATEEVAASIEAIQQETGQAVERMEAGTQEVTRGVESASTASGSLRDIVAAAQQVAEMIESIAAASEEQSTASGDVARNVEAISSMIRAATEGCTNSAKSVSDLAGTAQQLQALINRFKLQGSDQTETQAEPESAAA
ncbi:MAG: methyl-accepting chemotaxis protein [Phycisphaeraceae bacterium]